MKTAKCVVVDPVHKVVAEGWLTFEEAQRWIGCELMERVSMGGGTSLWLNEEGWLIGEPVPWLLRNRLFAGKAVFVGEENEEGWSDVRIPLDLIQTLVGWVPDHLREKALDLGTKDMARCYSWDRKGMEEMRQDAKRREAEIETLLAERERCRIQETSLFRR